MLTLNGGACQQQLVNVVWKVRKPKLADGPVERI